MKSLVKLQIIAITILAMVTWSFAATVTVTPSQIPKGAYVNGGDGDQQFSQAIVITIADDGAGTWIAANDIVITFPTDIRLADTDQDGNFIQEVSVSATYAGANTIAVSAATAGSITLDGAAAAFAAGDIVMVLFPITTEASPASSTADYTITYGTDIPEASGTTVTVTFADTLTTVAFAADWGTGSVQSSLRGDVFPNAIDLTVVTALPDLIEEQVTLGTDRFINGTTNWDLATLAGADDDFVHPWSAETGEVGYRLWASQTADLRRIDLGSGAIPISDSDELNVDGAVEGDAYFDDQADAGLGTLLSGHHLAEGNWWFYVTSSVTADWVLGTSDTVDIRHHPVFYAGATNSGTESGIDYVDDDIFLPGGTDNLAVATMESGGVLGRDGAIASGANPNLGDVDIFWMFEDVDDNADVQVFKSTSATIAATAITTSGTSPNEVVTGLTGATKLHTLTRTEEGDTNWVNWDIYTSDSDYDTANVYYLYIVTNDGKNQVLESVTDVAGPTQLAVTVKHYPSFNFHDPYASIGAGLTVPINTSSDRYAMVNWGELISGDQDADDVAVIKLYYSTDNYGAVITANGGVLNAATVTHLTTDATTFLMATITDSSDTQDQNQYMWDLRAAGLTDATPYYIYAHIAGGSDNLVVQYNSVGDWTAAGLAAADDRDIVPTHGNDFIAKTPIAGAPIEVYMEDRFDFQWIANNADPALTTQLVQIFMVPKGTVLADAAWSATSILATDDFVWLYPTADNGENPTNATTGATSSTGKQTIIFGATADGNDHIDTDMGGGAISAGEYDVYYYYSTDATFSANESGVKAAGTIFYNALTREETNLELAPRQATLTVGDTVTVTIYAKDTGPDPAMLSLFLDIPSTYFSIIDQVSGTAGTQPIADEAVNFAGTVLLNSLTTSGSTYQINYIERHATSDALATSLAVGSFQLVVTSNSTSPALLDNLVTWSSSGGRVTAIDNTDGTSQSITYHATAGNYMLAKPGSISGIVDFEGRTDASQTASFYVVPKGSLTPITDSDYLSANSDADGTDGVQVTLGAGGTYTLERVPTGSYDVIIKKDSYISELIEDLDVQPLSSTTANFVGADKVLAGDAAGYDHDGLSATNTQPDDEIDATDISAISAAFNTTSGDSLWNVYADIDGDGTVFVADLNLSASNQGKDADDDGDELPWYKSRNDKAIATLVMVYESANLSTYNVELSGLAGLHGYAVEMTINPEHWTIVSYQDGFATGYDSYSLSQENGHDALFAGVILGSDYHQRNDMEALSVTLEAKVMEPDAPSLTTVTLVDGQGEVAQAIISSGNMNPTEFSLGQNYPNPFNPVTSISFALPTKGNVALKVYNLLGKEVRTLTHGAMEPGSYSVTWNALDNAGRKVSTGMYFYRLMVDNKVVQTRKMLLLK